MGEVYRARDSRLDRDVAIKVLPEALARDKERILRFEREAKLLASLNHPHIAAIHGFEEVEGKRLLVMELVEGATLADRLREGALPVEEALTIGRQIAEALESAHERGIIHRDLKPANVKVTPDGTVKVLDFGLAKAMAGDATGTDIAHSPTITAQHTRPGVVLGTAAYMSPEQARGKSVDKRTDIWSFGIVLYECLAGTRPFEGETGTDLVAKILEREPDWSSLPPETPPIVQLLLRRCLAKDRNKRLHDIADARIDLEQAIADPTSSMLRLGDAAISAADARIRQSARRRPFLDFSGIATVLRLPGRALSRDRPATDSGSRSCSRQTRCPERSATPDGQTLAWAARPKPGRARLMLNTNILAASTAEITYALNRRRLVNFSPDSRWISARGFAGRRQDKARQSPGRRQRPTHYARRLARRMDFVGVSPRQRHSYPGRDRW
jgi:serine/threonine protein kinase